MVRYGKRAGTTVHEAEPFNSEPPRGALAEGPLTALDAFYVRGHGAVPEGDATSWRLRVDGLVEHEVDLSVAELGDGRFPEREVVATLLDDLGRWAWRLWRAEVDLRPGGHEILARAWDSAAATQPEDPATVWNPKGYVNNAWARIHVEAEG